MAQTIDERIVEMRIDNEQFERAANTTLGTLSKLREASDFEGLETSLKGINVDFLGDAFEHLADRIDKSVNGIWSTVRRKIGEDVVGELKKLGKVIEDMSSIGQIDEGFGKFGEKTKSVATLMAQGYELEKVNDLMEQLNWFTDETSYNFTEMVNNIAKFTATGQDLDKSVTAMEGIALWAAASGQGAQKASQAMYQLSQAMSKGALKYDDYKSIQNASMDTKEFREQAVKAAEALGTLKKVGEDTWQTLGSNTKAEAALAKAQKQLASAQEDLQYAYQRQASATTESQAMSTERAVRKAEEKVQELQEKVREAQADLKTGFSLSGLFSSDALSRNQWFTSDVMMEVFNQYSKAVSEIQRYMDEHKISTASEAMKELESEAQRLADDLGITLDEAFQKLGYDIDEFSLKAFKAGQEARTWGDVVDSVKDAVSTGWMKTFELVFGQADKAIEFWTDLAERFYDIFAEGGNTRNEIFEIAFGTGEAIEESAEKAEKSISGWTRFENSLKDSGVTMEDFEKSCRKVIDSTDNLALDHIIDEYGSLRAAFEKGAISGDQFRAILDDLQESTGQSLGAMSEDVEKVGHSFEELKEVAMGIIRGDYGNGAERRQILEELGYNYDLVQAMAEIIYNGGQGYVGITEELLKNEYPTYYEMLVREMAAAGDAVQNTNSMLADSDAILQDIQEHTIDLTGDVKKDIDKITGSDLFKGSLLNLLNIIQDLQGAYRDAVEDAFGSIEERGARIYQILQKIHQFTVDIQLSDSFLTTVQRGLTGILTWLGNILRVLVELGKGAGDALGLIATVGEAAATALDRFFKGAFGRGYTDFIRGTGNFTDKLIDLITSARKEIQNLGDAIKDRLPEIELAFYRAGRTIRPALSAIGDVLKELWPVLKEVLSTLKLLAGVGLDWLWSLVQGFLGKDFSDGVNTVSQSISEKLVGALKTAQTWLKDFSNTVTTKLPNAEKVLYNLGASIRIFGSKVLESFPVLLQGISRAITDLVDFIGGMIPSLQPYTNAISDWIRETFGVAAEDGEKYLPEFSALFEKFQSLANEAFDGVLKQLGFEDLDAVNAELEERFGNLWTTITTWWDQIKKFFSSLSLGDDQNGIFDSIKSIFKDVDFVEVLKGSGKNASEAMLAQIFPTDEEIDGKTSSFWERLTSGLANKFDISSMFPSEEDVEGETNNFLVKLYKGITSAFDKINWGQVFTIGKAATFAMILFNVNRFFNNLKVSVDPQKNGFLGIVDAIKKPFQNFSSLLFEMTKSVKKNAEGDQWIKLSVAIGILTASLLALSVIDEQTLFNVASVLAGLMLLLKWIAASGNGLQIFSNNVKQITKDSNNISDIFKNLDFKDLKLKALFENITLTGNVIPPAMGALIGIGVCIAAIGAVLIKLRDLKSWEDLKPAIIIVGGIMGALTVMLLAVGAMGPRLKGVGSTLLALSIAVAILAKVVASLNDLQLSLQGVGAIVLGFLMIWGTIMSLTTLLENIDKEGISGKKLLGLASTIIAFGTAFGILSLAIRVLATADTGALFTSGVALVAVAYGLSMIIKSFASFPKEQSFLKASAALLIMSLALGSLVVPIGILAIAIGPLGWNLAIAAGGLAIFAGALAGIFVALEKWTDSDTILINAAAMTIMAVAIGVLSLAIENIANIDWTGLAVATGALVVLSAALAVILGLLSEKTDSTKLMAVAIAMGIGAAAIGVLSLALAGLAIGIGTVVQDVSWEQFGGKAQQMADALAPLAPWIAGLVAALLLLTAICGKAGAGLLQAGIGFAGVGAGVYLVVAALANLPAAIEGIVKSIEIVKKNAATLIEFAGFVVLAIMSVLIAHKAHLATTMISLATTCANALSSATVLTQLSTSLMSIGKWLIAFLVLAMPGLTEKLIVLLIGLIDGLANAINAHASEIAASVEKAVIALLNVIVQVAEKLIYDALGGLFGGIGWIIEKLGWDRDKDNSFLGRFFSFEGWHDVGAEMAEGASSAFNYVFDEVDKTVEDRSEQTAELATSTLADGVESGSGDIANAVENAVNGAGDAASAAIDAQTDSTKSAAEQSASTIMDGFGGTLLDKVSEIGAQFGYDINDLFQMTGTDGMSQLASAFTGQSTELDAAGAEGAGNLMGGFAEALKGQVPDEMYNMLAELGNANEANEFGYNGIGADIIGSLGYGAENALPAEMQGVTAATVDELDSANRNLESDYKVVGEFGAEKVSTGYQEEIKYRVFDMVADTINGLNYEMVDARDYLLELGRYIGRNVREGYEEEFDINSPSKVMAQEMAYTIEGLAVGAKKKGHVAFDAMRNVGDGMLDAMRNSMGMLALAVDQDYDLQPRITPVVDLGPASRGASALRSMMQGGTLATALEGYNSLAGLNVSGAVLNYTNQNGPVTSAINDLSKRMDDLGRTLDTDRNFNVGIRVDKMAVRDDSDITAISKQLAKEVRVALRQKSSR